MIIQKMELLSIVDRIIVMDYAEKVLDGPKEEVIKELRSS